MNKLLLFETSFAVISQILAVIIIKRIYYTQGMRSRSWIIIGIAFLILLIKWIFGAALVWQIFTLKYAVHVYEGLTDLFAGLLLIGYYMLYLELSAGERFSLNLRRSLTISKNIIEEKPE